MPPVVLFRKQWRMGADDFVFPSLIEVLTRAGWTVALSFVLGFHIHELENLKCLGSEYRYTTGYLIGALVIQVLSTVNLVLLCHHSSKGRIFDKRIPHPRRFVSVLIYINIVLTLSEFILTCIGTYFAIKDIIRCISEENERIVIIIVIVVLSLTYILLFIKLFLALSTVKPFTGGIPEEERYLLQTREKVVRQESEVTYRGLRCLMPCSNDEGTIQAFQEISLLLSRIFHDHEMVPSDIVAGLLLLHFKHGLEKQRLSVRREAQAIARIPVPEEDLVNLKHFYKYSMAAYGCWWFILDNPCTNTCLLGHYINLCPCFPCMGLQEGLVEGDGCCSYNFSAAKALLRLEDDDVVIFDNRNRIQEVPYFLCVDHETRSLVISIRGTLSISDMFTDLRGEPGPLTDCIPEATIGVNPEFKAHKGMIAAARYVYLRLHGLPVGEREEQDQDRVNRVNVLSMSMAQFQDYSIVVTGHSLGAGTAAILTFLLRSKYSDRDIKCYAYSPPGGLLCPAAADESEKFTVSLVVGDDVIPRTSLPNIARLSYDIRNVCERCELPKYKLLGHGALAFCCCVKSSTIKEEVERLCSEESDVPEEAEVVSVREEAFKPAVPSSLQDHNDLINLNSPDPTSVKTYSEELLETKVFDPTLSSGNGTTEIFRLDEKKDSNKSERKNSELSISGTSSHNALLETMTAKLDSSRTEPVTSICAPMYLPGRIVYIEEEDSGKLEVSTRNRNSFSRILVSPRMMMDHMPNHVRRILDKC